MCASNASTDTCCFANGWEDATECPPGASKDSRPEFASGLCAVNGHEDCGTGCLFEVRSDPAERRPLSGGAGGMCGPDSCDDIKAALTVRVEELKQSAFVPVRCDCDDGFGGISCAGCTGIACYPGQKCGDPRACEVGLSRYGGFWVRAFRGASRCLRGLSTAACGARGHGSTYPRRRNERKACTDLWGQGPWVDIPPPTE